MLNNFLRRAYLECDYLGAGYSSFPSESAVKFKNNEGELVAVLRDEFITILESGCALVPIKASKEYLNGTLLMHLNG